MAFDAMKGLSEALRDREERHLRVEKHDISDEAIEQTPVCCAHSAAACGCAWSITVRSTTLSARAR